MQMNLDTAKIKLAQMGMDDMPVMEFTPRAANVGPDWFARFRELRRKFMSELGSADGVIETLSFMNLSNDEFMNLMMGHALPANLSIRFRVPLVWGGELNTDNMFMCPTFPYSHNLDRFMMAQSDATTVYLPMPERKVYLPTHTTGGGPGGNATEDRLAQISAQLAASRGME